MKTSTVVAVAAVAALGLYAYSKRGETSAAPETESPLANVAGGGATPVSSYTAPVVDSAKDVTKKVTEKGTPTDMARSLSLVQNKGTNSKAELAKQWSASKAGVAYSGVSSGVAYTVSAPHKPSAAQSAALKKAGYSQYA